MSPILVRPVREQLEHDRVIRFLQGKFRRRFDVGINPGSEQNSPVGGGASPIYPDVVLASAGRGRKVEAVIEVETVESVNNLEALAEWAPFGRLKPAFYLYVPAAMAEVAKRLCTDGHVAVAEIHSYHWVGDEMRFLQIYRAPSDGRPKARAAPSKRGAPSRKPAKATSARKKGARPSKPTARRKRK